MTEPNLTDTLTDLEWITTRWPDLHQARLIGTPLPYREPQLTREQRNARDAEAKTERAEADDRMPGYSRAPVRIPILDMLGRIVMRADLLHEQVAQTVGHDRLPPATSATENPARFLDYIRELLPEAADTRPELLARAATWAARTRHHMATTLGELEDGHVLKCVCPFCLGRTAEQPTGGAHTLRIRIVPAPAHLDVDTELVVVCESGTCEPFAGEVSMSVWGRPAWPTSEWEWLAKRIDVINGAVTA